MATSTQLGKSILPSKPFDGQKFIDYYGITWFYSSVSDCWVMDGAGPDIPVADEDTTGLLSRELKEVLDTIPNKGGHFGLVVKPLLSVKPFNVKPLFSDSVLRFVKTESGTTIYGKLPFTKDKDGNYNPYIQNSMVAKLMRFSTGKLKNKDYLIFDNDKGRVFVDGDLSSVAVGDKFELYDLVDLNPHGIISGNIELVSDSLDIKCVENKNGVLVDDACGVKDSDAVKNPRGISFSLKEEFLKTLCFNVPGCKGPSGKQGLKGNDGKPGTGDGPKGDVGTTGEDAIEEASFTGVKFVDLDDVYDTAVVGLELDADAGKLHVVKSRMRVPIDGKPADQVIASGINRSVSFSEEFLFDIVKPSIDPVSMDSKIGVTLGGDSACFFKSEYENDVLVAVLPKGFKSGCTEIGVRWLGDLLNDIANHFRQELLDASVTYDKQIKEHIVVKDEEAKKVLCELAQNLAECEWELPLEFCIGLTGGDCAPGDPDGENKVDFPLANKIFGGDFTDPKGQIVALPTILGGEGDQFPEYKVYARIDGKSANGVETNKLGQPTNPSVLSLDFPAGDYLLVWDSGTIKDVEFPYLGHFVGGFFPVVQDPTQTRDPGYGVRVKIQYPGGTEDTKLFPVPDILKKSQASATTPLGAYCVRNSGGQGAAYFCDYKPFLSSKSQPEWIEGAAAGYWSPGDQPPPIGSWANGGPRQVPPPGTPGNGYQIKPRITYDANDVEDAYRNADLTRRSVSWSFNSDGGNVSILCPIQGAGTPPQFDNRKEGEACSDGVGQIRFKLYRVTNQVTQIQVS